MIANQIESVVDRISRQATLSRDQLAVQHGEAQLTYGELECKSKVLAAQLRQAGAGPDRSVALFLERSVDFVVAALAVLRSGAAYLPIDPNGPQERTATILSDADAIAVLANLNKADRVPTGSWRVIGTAVTDTNAASALADFQIEPDALAYIIYTSGSTGQPKGVEITHTSLNNLVDWHLSAFAVTETDRASQVASVGFDAVVWEMWPYLATGASIHIPDEMTRKSWGALQDWIVAERITISFVPTPLAEPLIRTTWPPETVLRVLLTGGDVLRQRPLANLPFSVINNYGPTECTVVATSGVVLPDIRGSVPTIGRPISNVNALVLDSALRPVPPGEVGELCIGGPSVGRGYVRRPELTAQQFVWYASPVGEPTRIYRTGDRVKIHENGELAFVGRLDDQIKIRGYRIEPEEIAKTLNSFPGVETCTVLGRDVGESGTTLIAYVVACDGAHLSASELGEFLAERLPQYMVPAVFVLIPELPLTANGKVDKAALPPLCDDNLLPNKPTTRNVLSASDQYQRAISDLICGMVGRRSIGPDENFFMIGGHSMLGVELVARIRDQFGVLLSLRQLFTAPTARALSTVVAVLKER